MTKREKTQYVIKYKDNYHKIFTLEVNPSISDFGLYLFLPGIKKYFASSDEFQERQINAEVSLDGNEINGPHISFHHSGQVHIKNGSKEIVAGPLRIPRLLHLRAQNIAVIQPFSIQNLPLFPAESLRKADVTEFSPDLENILVSIWANNSMEHGEMICDDWKSIYKKRLYTYLEIGIRFRPTKIIKREAGISVLAGFSDSAKDIRTASKFLTLLSRS